MGRREFVKLLGGAVAAWPAAVPALRPKMPTIGYLSSFSEKQSGPAIAAVRRGLSEGGLVDGQDVAIEFRFSDGQYDRLPGLSAELVRQRVDLIFGAGPPAAIAAKAQTNSIPIVFVVGDDPVAGGLVTNLSRPGGNVTGLRLALPTMYPYREFSGPGGLISYGTNRLNTYRLAGGYASRIIKGTPPGDLPVIQPTVFDLVINLKTAKALGLGIPDQLRALADQVIE